MPLLSQYQTFYLSAKGDSAQTAELNSFLKSHRIINIEKFFVDNQQALGWAFLLEFADSDKKSDGASSASGSKVDWREVLSEKEFAIYDKLRSVRKAEAEKAGIPVYAVFTNEQLAFMAQNLPKSKADLLAIKNVGEQKVAQFGEVFLKTVAEIGGKAETPGAETADKNMEIF